jgi:hypothetical protein
MRTLLPILGVALLFGLVALSGSAAAAPDTGAETATNNEAVNETVTVAGEDVTVKAGADEGDAGAFAFASAGADPGEDGSGAGGGVRVANEYGGVNYDGDAGGDVEAAGTDVASFGAGSGVFAGIPGQNPFYGAGVGGGVTAAGENVGASAACFVFASMDPTGDCDVEF